MTHIRMINAFQIRCIALDNKEAFISYGAGSVTLPKAVFDKYEPEIRKLIKKGGILTVDIHKDLIVSIDISE